MLSTAKSLDDLMREHLGERSYTVPGGRDLFMEVMDTTTGLVWKKSSQFSGAGRTA